MTVFGMLIVATLAWGALTFAAVYPWAYWPLAAAATSAGVWAIVATRAWRDARLRALAAALAVVAVAIAIQTIALPQTWLDRWSPGVDRLLPNLEIGYRATATHALSIAPDVTVVALALFGAFATLLIGLVRGLRLVSLSWLARSVLSLGLVLAIVGIVQAAFIDRSQPLVYGFWKPQYGATPFGPFINKNHFAGWMIMAMPLSLAYLVAMVTTERRPRDRTWPGALRWTAAARGGRIVFVAVSLMVMSLAVVLTGSRSGMTGLAIALSVVGAAVAWRPETRPFSRVLAVGLVSLGVVAVVWAGLGSTVERFSQAAGAFAGRWNAWHDTTHIIRDFLVSGTGLGTFDRAMLVYQTGDRTSMYAQAHNDYLQLVAEGGLLVALPAALAAGVIVWGIWQRLRADEDDVLTRWLRVGAVAGLVGIATQSVVEFSLQMPGNTVMCVLLLGLALYCPPRGIAHAHRV